MFVTFFWFIIATSKRCQKSRRFPIFRNISRRRLRSIVSGQKSWTSPRAISDERKKIERERIISTDVGTLIAPPSNWIVNKYLGWRTPSCLEWMQLFARSCDLLARVNCRQNYLIIAFLLAGSQCRAARCLDDDNVWEKMQFLTFPNRASLNKSLFPSRVLSWVYGSCFYFESQSSIALIPDSWSW